MYRGNYGPPAMGPSGYEGSANGSSVKKKKKGKTASSPADLLERIQKRLRSENFFDINEPDAMSSPSSSNPRTKFSSSNHASNSFPGPVQANARGNMTLPRPLPPAQHSTNFSTHFHLSHDYSYPGQHGSDYHHQQPEVLPKHSDEAQSSNSARNLSSRLGPPALAGNEMRSGRESVPFIPGLGGDVEITGPEGFPTVASFNKPSITDFLDESFNSQDPEPPAQTDYWKHGVSEGSSTSMHSRNSSRAHPGASSASDLQQNSFNTEFKSGRSGTFSFLGSASRMQNNSAVDSTVGKDRFAYSSTDSSKRFQQKNNGGGKASSRGFSSRNSPARSNHPSSFATKSGRTGSFVSPANYDKEKNSGTFNLRGARSSRKSSSKWEKKYSGYNTGLGNDAGLSKNLKNSFEERVKESTVSMQDEFSSSTDQACEMDIPLEALQCHVCRLQNFSNLHVYTKHLQTPQHQHMFQLLEVRNESLEMFKIAAAKLSSRALEYEVMADGDGNIKEVQGASNFIRCSYCFATVLNTAVDAHNQLLQHKELVEFTRPLCCGIKFVNRRSYESHKSTTKHLAGKFTKEKEFVSQVIRQIDDETMKSKRDKPNANGEETSHNPLNIPQSTYIQRVLAKLESDPCIQDGKSNYCLVCEVSVPEYRRTFHPSCSDHHENKQIYCTVHKSRIARLVASVLSEIGQPIKSDHAEVSDANTLGTVSLSSKLTTASEKKKSTAAPEGEGGGDDFEYDFEGVSSEADEKSKKKVSDMSTSEGGKMHLLQTTEKEHTSLGNISSAATLDNEAVDMEVSSPNGSGEDGQFEYDFGESKCVMDAKSTKPVDAKEDKASEIKRPLVRKGTEAKIAPAKQQISESGDGNGEEDEEFDYEFSNTVPELSTTLPRVVATATDRINETSSKLQSLEKVDVQSKTSTLACNSPKTTIKSKETDTIEKKDCSSSQKTVGKKEKSKNMDEVLEKFYVQFEDADVLKGAPKPLQKISKSSADKPPAQEEEEEDVDDEFDYQFEAPAQANASTSSTDGNAIVSDTMGKIDATKRAAGAENIVTTAQNQSRDYSCKGCKVTEADEGNSEEDEFEYNFVENVPDDGHLNEEKGSEGQSNEELEGRKTSEDDEEFEYQMEVEKGNERDDSVIKILKNATGRDQVEENAAEEDYFEYQMEERTVAEEGKVEKRHPAPAVVPDSNIAQDELSGEDEFEYEIEAQDFKKNITEKAKLAKDDEAKSNETEDNLAKNSDLNYGIEKERYNFDSVKDEDEEADEFEYQLEDMAVAEEKKKTNEEKDLKTDVEEQDADEDYFDYEMLDKPTSLGPTSAPDAYTNMGGNDHPELEEEEEEEEDYTFDYELPEDEVEDSTEPSPTTDICRNEASEMVETATSDVVPSTESSTEEWNGEENDTEDVGDEFDYDLEEYETEIDTVSGALGKVSDAVKIQISVDSDSSDENTTNLGGEKVESVKSSSPIKFKIPSIVAYSSGAVPADAVDTNLCKNVKSANSPAASDNLNVLKAPKEIKSADTQSIAVASPAVISTPSPARTPCAPPKQTLETSPVRISTRTHSHSLARGSGSSPARGSASSPARDSASSPARDSASSPARDSASSPARGSASSPARDSATSSARSSANSPARIPSVSTNRAIATSPFRAGPSALNSVVSLAQTAAPSIDSVTEAEPKADLKSVAAELESIVTSNRNGASDIIGQADIKRALPKDSKIVEPLTQEPDLLTEVNNEIVQDLPNIEALDAEVVESLRSKSVEVESIEKTPVKVNIIDSDNVKKIIEKNEDEQLVRVSKTRSRSSRSTPQKATPIDEETEAVLPIFRRVVKRGRTSTPATPAKAETPESDELVGTPTKRRTRGTVMKQEVKEENTATLDVLLEVIDEKDSSPRKKNRASKRNSKEQTAVLEEVASEVLPALSQEEEMDEVEDEQKVKSPRGRRGGRARRGNSTKVALKNLDASINADNPGGVGKVSGIKREASPNSDNEGSVCSVTRGGRPSKRGRGGGAVAKSSATPKTSAASTSKATAGTRTPATGRKGSSTAASTPQTGKGKEASTPIAELRSKRRSCAPVRFE